MVNSEVNPTKGRRSRKNITLKDLKYWLTYNPETGKFTRNQWSPRAKYESDGTAHLTKPDGDGREYFISVNSTNISTLWVAWFFVHGDKPPTGYVVIPKNDDYKDSRPGNLILERKSTNNHKTSGNKLTDPNKYSLPIGVYKRRCKYAAKISINRKSNYLGSFDTPKEASEIYQSVAKELHETGSCYVIVNGKGKLISL